MKNNIEFILPENFDLKKPLYVIIVVQSKDKNGEIKIEKYPRKILTNKIDHNPDDIVTIERITDVRPKKIWGSNDPGIQVYLKIKPNLYNLCINNNCRNVYSKVSEEIKEYAANNNIKSTDYSIFNKYLEKNIELVTNGEVEEAEKIKLEDYL